MSVGDTIITCGPNAGKRISDAPFQELWTLAYIEVNTTTWDTEDTANDVGIAVFSRRAFFARFLAALPETHPAHEDSW